MKRGVQLTKESKKKYESKGILKIPYFSLSICISIGLAVGVYFLNQEMKLGFDKSLTAYVAILGAVPTVYLWIIKERKKEEELKNKKQELRQVKISELNKVYVDAISQFYNHESFLAGAYSLSGLIDDWINLSNDDENKEYYYTRIQQILGIILSKTEERKLNHLFKVLSSNIVFKMIRLKMGKKIDLRNFDLSNLDLSGINFNGYDLRGINFSQTNLSEADLTATNLTGTDLSQANLENAKLTKADLTATKLLQANLKNADLSHIETFLTSFDEANLNNAKLIHANIFGSFFNDTILESANLENATVQKNDLSSANFKRASFRNADLSGEDISHANLSEAKLIKTNLLGANLFGTVLDNATFIDTKIDDNVFYQRGSSHLVLKLESFLNSKSITLHLLKNSTLIDIPDKNLQNFLDHLKKDYKNDMKNISGEDLKLAFEKSSEDEN